jgi:hypothetical protein
MEKKIIQIIICVGMVLATYSMVGVPLVAADAPAVPSEPYPMSGSNGVTIFIDVHWANAGADVTYDIYFGTDSQPPLVASHQATSMYNPGILVFNTTYYWQVVAFNNNEENTPGPVWSFMTSDDQPPFYPTIVAGPIAAGPYISLNFTAIAPDPEGDQVYYQWDWGDGNMSSWIGPFVFGDHVVTSNRWAQDGTYDIKVRAKDSHGKIGDWSSAYSISIRPQIRFTMLKPGYVLICPFGFDLMYGYVNYFDMLGMSVVIGTLNSEFTINATTSGAVHSVLYEMGNLISSDEIWTASDDNVSENNSIGYFFISPGLYQATATAYDAHGNLIDKTQREFVFYYQWKFTIIKALLSRISGGKLQAG